MEYYAERNGLLQEDVNISLKTLKEYFYKIYQYFDNQQYFEVAMEGVWIKPEYGDMYQKIPPLLSPSPDVFFLKHLNSTRYYPIWEHYTRYGEDELFTVIEILYNNICEYNYDVERLDYRVRKEFAIQINNILKFYNGGYFLEPTNGYITKGLTDPTKEMYSEDLSSIIEDDILEKIRTSVKLYYRYDSDMETKKNAITILANILEPLRNDLKEILNEKYETPKNEHDKLIFEIVNGFNIRHNNSKQKTDYETEIWYDWMIQYYTSVIITYYKLKQIHQ